MVLLTLLPAIFSCEAIWNNGPTQLLKDIFEITKIKNSIDKNLTIVPVTIFLNERNKIKCEIAIAKGKKNYDKRETIKKRDADRELKQLH